VIEVAVSVALHVLVIWFLVRPAALDTLNPDLQIIEQGAGGPGPAGGGGGGTRGTGGVKYVQVAPPAVPTPPQVEAILPPVQPTIELPKPAVTEPVVPVELPKLAVQDPKTEVKVQSPVIGAGGGTGTDGTAGNGPGSGGGVGSGVGTGRGSGIGPGTGGGSGDVYSPTPIEMQFPFDAPKNVKGTKVIVNFDVDERGRVLKIEFTPTKDGGFNRKLDEIFKKYRFRPAVTRDGVPVRAIYQMTIDL
jgi:protein TonB